MHVEDSIAGLVPPQRSPWRAFARAMVWTAVVLYFLFAILVLALRYWLLPLAGSHTGLIEQKVSRALGERITIGAIEAGWQGLRPELLLTNVTVHDRSGRPALTLPLLDATFSWTSLVRGSLHFHSLVLDQPNLEIRRDSGGKLYVAGIELHPQTGGDSGIADWLLAQREIVIRNARLTWDDELRRAPRLVLPELSFVLRKGLTAHRFALRAKPPSALASALDLRGEFDVGDRYRFRSWSGRIYTELEYTDLAAWRQWIDYPLEIGSGRGGLRMWLGFADEHLTELTADVALADVAMRLAKDLPVLQLSLLEGRLGVKQARGAFDASGRKVRLRTEDGVSIEPTDFALRWEPAGDKRPERAEFQTAALQLEPLARLAEFLPLPAAVRARVALLAPRGNVSDLKLTWTGGQDRELYSVRGRFAGVGARAYKSVPGFSGLSGQVEASEKGGTLSLTSEHVALQLPGVLVESEARFDRLAAQVEWKLAQDRVELRFGNISVANPDLAGTLSGSFATRSGSPGVIDLTGNFSRVDGQAVYRYVPWLPSAVVDYLKAAVQDGHSDQVRIRLKGDLSDFPFAERSKGVFQVRARLKDVKFRFAQSWPELADVAGELELEGRSLRVAASQAAMQGVRIRSVRAAVPDLFNGNEHLRVEGEAEDQTADFLRFVEASPVSGMLDGFTRGMRAAGNGRLQIQLDIPLRRLEQVKLAGSYQFLGNQLRINEELPPLTQVTGRLEFTESAVNARAITAQFLGGPMTVAVATREGVIAVNANGTANATAFPQTWGGALRKRVSGGTAWQAGIAAGRGRPVTLLVESQLAGVAIDLPAPFSKRPSEPMAFRLECVLGPEGQAARRSGQMKIALGRAVSAHILGERRGDQFVLERGVIAFNEPAVLTEREGISVTGSLQYVDLDRWRVLLADGGDGKRAGPALVTLKVDTLDFAGKRFHEVALRARTVGTAWAANVAAKELAGDITWRPEGRGRVIARLKHFIVPDNVPGAPSTEAPSREMPAFDVVADSFTLRNMNFGRLELAAINEDGQDWRIEKLVLANEDSNLSASGTWQSWKEKPTVNVDLKLEVNDVGKYLERIGFPGTMQRGTATLEGKLGWEGAPSSVDYPTLRGNLSLNAAKGQFLRADPGVAKLLGILSLQSWVTLDFRDLFAKGFAFDSASGSATVASGVLATQDFRMRGASAQVSMRGTVHLVHETQDLYLRVVPSLGDTAAWIPAIMINPVWGLGTLVLQRILKDPLGQILAFEYHATGSWEKPQVERVRAEVRSADVGAP